VFQGQRRFKVPAAGHIVMKVHCLTVLPLLEILTLFVCVAIHFLLYASRNNPYTQSGKRKVA